MMIRGPILNPRPDGSVQLIADGVLAADAHGRIGFVGAFDPARHLEAEQSRGLLCPAFFDCHIHIPQHPIRGRFMEGVGANPPNGRLITGLNRNVFPAEGKCADAEYARNVVAEFASETLSQGVIGGAAYMTVHLPAARSALEMLPQSWSVGPVLMNMNCPEYLRTDESTWQQQVESLARDFGRRVIVTDRFAVSVDSNLRRSAVALAKRLGLRMQTHLNEQIAEKQLVERELYPQVGCYTLVYENDGLLDCDPILAHCVRMSPGEFMGVSWRPGACIAHCPTSNTLLGSGVMPLELLYRNGIDYAICTDVGASPTTSLLCEMAQFLKVHHGHSPYATAQEALYRTTLAAARVLGLDRDYGSFDFGKSFTFVEIDCDTSGLANLSAEEVIRERLLQLRPPGTALSAAIDTLRESGLEAGAQLELLERDVFETVKRLEGKALRVVKDGQVAWRC